MKNFIAKDSNVTVTAPADVDSGDLVIVGGLVGVAQTDALSGQPVAIVRRGLFGLTKVAGFAAAQGDPARWDTGNDRLSADGDLYLGIYAAAAGSAATEGQVVLAPAQDGQAEQVVHLRLEPKANAKTSTVSPLAGDGDIVGVSYYTETAPASALGTALVAVLGDGTTVLNAATVDAEAFTEDALTALTLTATTADLSLDAGDLLAASITSNNADLVPGTGIDVFVTVRARP